MNDLRPSITFEKNLQMRIGKLSSFYSTNSNLKEKRSSLYRSKSIHEKASLINSNLVKEYVPTALKLPKIELQNSLKKLNLIDKREYQITPFLYLTDFERNLLNECKNAYEITLNRINEIRSI